MRWWRRWAPIAAAIEKLARLACDHSSPRRPHTHRQTTRRWRRRRCLLDEIGQIDSNPLTTQKTSELAQLRHPARARSYQAVLKVLPQPRAHEGEHPELVARARRSGSRARLTRAAVIVWGRPWGDQAQPVIGYLREENTNVSYLCRAMSISGGKLYGHPKGPNGFRISRSSKSARPCFGPMGRQRAYVS